MYITLRCGKCDNAECNLARYFIPEDSQEGCTREVNDEQAENFEHYVQEVLPFVTMYKNHQAAIEKLTEIYSFLESIYTCPIGKLLDSKGKVIEDPNIVSKRQNRVSK